MQDKIRVALVGTSWYPDWMHLPALKSHPNAQISAICGRNRERAEELGRKYEIPNIFTDYKEMFAHGNLDAAIIATPDDTHYPITMAALDAGLHVICDKPLAFTFDQAKAMLSKAESANVKHMTYFTYRFVPHIRYLCQLIDEGYIGNCYDIQIQYLGGYGRQAGYHWQWDRQHGLGVLGMLGTHVIDLAHRLVGKITEVQANLSIRDKETNEDGSSIKSANDSVSMMVRFTNNATGTILVSDTAYLGNRMHEQRIVLYGDKGTLEAYTNQYTQTIYGIRNDETEFHNLPIPVNILQGINQQSPFWTEQYARIFTEQSVGTRLFIDSILADKPITPSFYDGMRTQAVIEAVFEFYRNNAKTNVQ